MFISPQERSCELQSSKKASVPARLNAFMEKGKLNSKMIAEYCNMAMDSSVENNIYVNKVWVQCENESCLKWRLLSSEDAAKVDHNESWYCFMNSDLRYNKCSVSEEDFPEESQLHQSGFKIVYSQLPLGSLVLVKLQNWPSWPGILCPDPFKGKYVTYDLDGNVEQYHVEFLGDPHSRSWIDAAFVGHYSITLKPGKCTNKKKWYKSALQEAYLLYGYSHEQRLERCCLSKQGCKVVVPFASAVYPLMSEVGLGARVGFLVEGTSACTLVGEAESFPSDGQGMFGVFVSLLQL
ncbi:zinc finger CW-type PWWP domain protein 2 isoform X5 [Orcinus orca]|uniref:zinc finger CW-type PWWP domain protein 2 isoform X5 n=1 Tax=Orcinus orca TaxID=9733 RepID=UPI0021120218|nr:zinc finger CW-type PWWP domain protein 2 isoform X5 [Orcinus orca]